MVMALIDEFAADLASVEGEVAPQSFTWNGETYPCFASGSTRGASGAGIEWNATDDLTIVVRGSLFSGATPEKEQTITYNSRLYRIDNVLTAPGSAFLRLSCVYASRGA